MINIREKVKRVLESYLKEGHDDCGRFNHYWIDISEKDEITDDLLMLINEVTND